MESEAYIGPLWPDRYRRGAYVRDRCVTIAWKDAEATFAVRRLADDGHAAWEEVQ